MKMFKVSDKNWINLDSIEVRSVTYDTKTVPVGMEPTPQKGLACPAQDVLTPIIVTSEGDRIQVHDYAIYSRIEEREFYLYFGEKRFYTPPENISIEQIHSRIEALIDDLRLALIQ